MLKTTEDTWQTLRVQCELFPISRVTKVFWFYFKQSFIVQICKTFISDLLPVTFKKLQPGCQQ